jgi:formate dehydrogenase iron-sulfur subunit
MSLPKSRSRACAGAAGGFSGGHQVEHRGQGAGPRKYVVCNADEGDGTFADRMVMEGDPFN